MRVASHWSDSTVTFELIPEAGEPRTARHASLVGRKARFRLPVAVTADRVHPDVEALVAVLIVTPFATSLTVERPVSARFAEVVTRKLGYPIGPVDPTLAPREPAADGVVGLAFSGGADSSAALAVLPDDTVIGFLRRVDPPEGAGPSRYSDAAAMHACSELERRGRTVRVFESDVQHVRRPVGFTTDWVSAAGLLLLADVDHINGLAWGVIAETAYRIGHERWVEWGNRMDAQWGPVLAAVGLPMCQVTAGVSEVATSLIINRAPHGDLAQSCVRGTIGAPCQRCWKCFRKSLLHAALTGDWPDDAAWDAMLASEPVARLVGYPIKHENVVAWAMQGYPGRHPAMRQLAVRTRAEELDLRWLTRYYGPSIDLIPGPRRTATHDRLQRYLEPMTSEDESRMRAWDMDPMLADPATKAAHKALVRLLAPRQSPVRRARSLVGRAIRRLSAPSTRGGERP